MGDASRKPAVFVGSSREALDVAQELRGQLRPEFDARTWDEEGVFRLGQSTLEGLVESLKRFDFAVFVFSPDDLLKSRGEEFRSTRDNVIFELGLFMGHLGRERTIFLWRESKMLKKMTATFYPFEPAKVSPPVSDRLRCPAVPMHPTLYTRWPGVSMGSN